MADRFERLYELTNNLYSTGSPVIVSSGALLKDKESGSVVVQMKFQSVSTATIKAVSVDIAASDVMGQKLAGKVSYQYLDLSVHEGDFFGSKKAIIMPDVTTRTFEITKICVIFDDGETVNVILPLTALPKEKALISGLHEAELVNQYRILTDDRALFVPIEEKSIWQCACGKWNCGTFCTQCCTSKQQVFSAYNIDLLREHSASRLLMVETEKKKLEKVAKRAKHFLITAKIFCVPALLMEAILMIFGFDTNYREVFFASGFCAVSFLLLLFAIGKNTILTQVAFIGLAIGEIFYSQALGVGAELTPFLCSAIAWGLLALTSIKGFKTKLIRLVPLIMIMSFIKPLWILYSASDRMALIFFCIGSVVMSLSCGWALFSAKSRQG